MIHSTAALGYAGLGLSMLPVTLLPLPGSDGATKTAPLSGPSLSEPLVAAEDREEAAAPAAPAAPAALVKQTSLLGAAYETLVKKPIEIASGSRALAPPALLEKKKSGLKSVITMVKHATTATRVSGVSFGDAMGGVDFWLLFMMQLAVFGGGVADNQNLALIFESEGEPAASGLGVALFSLASTVSRVSVGVLSDRFSHVISRFTWLIIVAALGVVGQLMLSVMSSPLILTGTFVLGLSFGSFFTLVVPVVNEMYGQRQVIEAPHSRLPATVLDPF